MNEKKKHIINEDIIGSIENYINDDIDKLVKNQPLEMGDREIPDFDEFHIYQNILEEVNKNDLEKKYRYRLKNVLKWVSACVITLISLSTGYFLYQDRKNLDIAYQEVQTERGEKLLVLLPDGSKVWLNAESKLIYSEEFADKNRDVTLEGEAYFEIKKDSESPFQVFAEDMKIKVTGTSFNVSAYPTDKTITTTLDEGQIIIGHQRGASPKKMKPGETAVYKKKNNTLDIAENNNYRDASYWKDNKLTFKNSSLKDVLTILSRHFDVHFDIKNPKISSFTYTLNCKGSDLSHVIEMMEAITPVKFERITEDNYIVK